MVSELIMVAGWAGMPLLGLIIGGVAVRRQERHRGDGSPFLPSARLEELRRARARQPEHARGRMADAVRLAEAAPGAATPLRRRG